MAWARTVLLLAALGAGLGAAGCADTAGPQPDAGPAPDAAPAGDAATRFPCQPGEVRECEPPVPSEYICAPGERRCVETRDGAAWGPCEGALLCIP